jgi:hypothetical protein
MRISLNPCHYLWHSWLASAFSDAYRSFEKHVFLPSARSTGSYHYISTYFFYIDGILWALITHYVFVSSRKRTRELTRLTRATRSLSICIYTNHEHNMSIIPTACQAWDWSWSQYRRTLLQKNRQVRRVDMPPYTRMQHDIIKDLKTFDFSVGP